MGVSSFGGSVATCIATSRPPPPGRRCNSGGSRGQRVGAGKTCGAMHRRAEDRRCLPPSH